MAPDYQIRRAGPDDHAGVTRELAAYFTFLGEDVDSDGLDHDVADWQGEYDGRAGVMLVVSIRRAAWSAPPRCAASSPASPSSSACGSAPSTGARVSPTG